MLGYDVTAHVNTSPIPNSIPLSMCGRLDVQSKCIYVSSCIPLPMCGRLDLSCIQINITNFRLEG